MADTIIVIRLTKTSKTLANLITCHSDHTINASEMSLETCGYPKAATRRIHINQYANLLFLT